MDCMIMTNEPVLSGLWFRVFLYFDFFNRHVLLIRPLKPCMKIDFSLHQTCRIFNRVQLDWKYKHNGVEMV